IVAVPLLAGLLWWPGWTAGYALAFALYVIAAVTDYLDGYLARAQGTVSKLGIFLDPIADKLMVAAVILMLVGTRDIAGLNVIAALIILLR
ncbi:CDP-alcohol phosphatidyltransferase family protein, partial [Acinetobacter baumannii]